jgi:protein-histidine pros-kinase
VAIHTLDKVELAAIPMVALISGVTLWTAWVFWQHWRRTRSSGARLVAIAFALWGLHHLDYTLLRARGEWHPWGYYLDIVFELAVGIGFGVMVLAELATRLEARTRELAHLSTRMVRQHEEERRRLQRDLHDETAQTLSAVKMEVGMLRERADDVARDRLDHVLALVDGGIRGIRRVMHDLRPVLLDDLGLLPAIRSLADDVRERGTIQVETELPATSPPLAAEAELALFRAAQEALANVVRHADATRVTVHLRIDGPRLRLTVRDDGRGLAGGGRPGPGRSDHVGLAGMRERIMALGGSVDIQPVVPSGVLVIVELPIEEEA